MVGTLGNSVTSCEKQELTMTNEEGESVIFWRVVVTATNGESFTSLDLCENYLLACRFCGELMAQEVDFLHIPELLDAFMAEIYGKRP